MFSGRIKLYFHGIEIIIYAYLTFKNIEYIRHMNRIYKHDKIGKIKCYTFVGFD